MYANEMKTTWHQNLPPATEVDRYHAAVEAVITPERYGEWTVTELIDKSLSESISAKALDILLGYRRDLKVQMNNGTGRGVMVTLEVVTRQACAMDADRNRLDTFGITHTEKPQDGDIVEQQAETRGGRQLDGRMIEQYRARGEREHVYHEYKVKDGKIRVPFEDALNMLHARGFRMPTTGVQFLTIAPSKHDYEMGQYTGNKPKTRHISNWWFREVFPDAEPEPVRDVNRSSGRR